MEGVIPKQKITRKKITRQKSVKQTASAKTSKNGPIPVKNKTLRLIESIIDDSKGLDITVIDLSGKSSIADFMVIATGTSGRHVAAMADKIAGELKSKTGINALMEGKAMGDWVLIDAGEVIVHLFRPEVRTFYNLEKMWASDITTASAAR